MYVLPGLCSFVFKTGDYSWGKCAPGVPKVGVGGGGFNPGNPHYGENENISIALNNNQIGK